MPEPVRVIGIGDDGARSLAAAAIDHVRAAQILAGGERHHAFFPDFSGERFVVKSNLAELVALIRERRAAARIVVLASGDPLFYGIGSYLVEKLGRDAVEIVPHVSSMQLAFARAAIPWQNATLVSLHGKPIRNLMPAVEDAETVGIFTDETNTPAAIAQLLLDKDRKDFTAFVCENLDGPDERVRAFTLPDLASNTHAIAPLNVVILKRIESAPAAVDLTRLAVVGIPDDDFIYRSPQKGLITKFEIRVLSLAKLNLRPDSVVWDIGAGSGSVSVEAARLAPRGRVFAIEKNKPDFELIKTNLDRFVVRNVTAVNGRAPEMIDAWPAPDAAFIGGSGGELKEICSIIAAKQKPGSRLVINTITLENQALAYESLKGLPYDIDATLVNVSRSTPILNMLRYEALNPIAIFTGVRRAE